MLVATLLLAAGCIEDPATAPDEGDPWTRAFLFGNTAINSVEITTNQDGISADYLSDYVTAAALPDVDMEFFTTYVYLPVTSGLYSQVDNVSITAGRTDGSRTPNFFLSAEYVQYYDSGTETYEVHRLDGIFVGSPVLRPDNFANVVFDFDVDYVDASSSLVHHSSKTVEIYKR